MTARRPILAAVSLTFVLAIPMILLAVKAPVLVCATGMFVSGVVNDVIIVVWQTTLQTHVEPAMLSRISSYDFLGSLRLAPLGIYAAGPVSAALGVHETLLLCAGLVIAASLLATSSASKGGPSGTCTAVTRRSPMLAHCCPQHLQRPSGGSNLRAV